MMPIGKFGVDSCHVDGGRVQYGLGGHQRGRQDGGTGVAWDISAGVLVSCDHVGDNIQGAFFNCSHPKVSAGK